MRASKKWKPGDFILTAVFVYDSFGKTNYCMRNIYEIIHICTAVVQPQYKYELFHIYFSSFHCTGRNELNKLTSLPMCGFIAQLVEHRTGIAEVTGSNPVEALIFFFRLLLSNCLNWKIYCDDHASLSNYCMFLISTQM